MQSNYMVFAAIAALTLQGCSSRPREFTPTLAAAPADRATFDAAYAECDRLLVAGKLDSSGRLASAGAGAAAAGTMAVAGGALATSAGLYTGAAIASATVVLLPFVAIGGAFGLAKMKKSKKENAIKTAMSGCLHERGYDVASWEKAKKKRGASATVAAN